MISEVFVYLTLPGTTEPVTAGRYVLKTDRDGFPIGEFVYGRRYLDRTDAVELDPVELRLRPRHYTTLSHHGLFGALRDATPDAWGRKLIDRFRGSGGPLGELDYMLNSPDDRAGALGFGQNQAPPAPRREFNRTMQLYHLMEVADLILASEADPDAPTINAEDAAQTESLMRDGTSMGGTRPKTTVEEHDALWLAKFGQTNDRWNNPRVEHAMMLLAKECGIACAETKVVTVGDRTVILVQRFDREKAANGYRRHRMISALTMLRADEDERSKWSYLLLADEMRRQAIGGRSGDLQELFRRICFNALISNADDHPRNHAFLAKDRGWSLSPAYDLTPTISVSTTERFLAMSFGDRGRQASRANLLSNAGRFGLGDMEAETIVDDMTDVVERRWYSVARGAGVTERDCAAIRSAFVYDGFRQLA